MEQWPGAFQSVLLTVHQKLTQYRADRKQQQKQYTQDINIVPFVKCQCCHVLKETGDPWKWRQRHGHLVVGKSDGRKQGGKKTWGEGGYTLSICKVEEKSGGYTFSFPSCVGSAAQKNNSC